MPTLILIPIFIFALGLAIGSFLNVCIYRIPRDGLTVNSPRGSFCPVCETSIRPYDNIPVLSYLLLRGRCRRCDAKISSVYPLVELFTGCLFLLMYYRFGLTLDLVRSCLFVAVLVPISMIDARLYIIPNILVAAGLIGGLAIVIAIALERQDLTYLIKHLISAIVGGGALTLVAVLGSLALGKPAMGGGDIKLMVLIGLFLGEIEPTTSLFGWRDLLVVIVLSAFIGSIVGGILMIRSGKKPQSMIPYGPFLALAALLDLLWGEAMWMGYMRLLGGS
jgi:leader peptidase (prepilin peptidase) / N-methyltransferase